MKLLLLPLKLIAIPIALVCWAVKWVGTFVTAMSGWIFYVFASLLSTLSIILILFGEATFQEMISYLHLQLLRIRGPVYRGMDHRNACRNQQRSARIHIQLDTSSVRSHSE